MGNSVWGWIDFWPDPVWLFLSSCRAGMIVVLLENRVGKVKVALIQRWVCRTTDGKPSVLSSFSIPGKNGCIYTGKMNQTRALSLLLSLRPCCRTLSILGL